jgi:uncharacterized membrane protein HdeD (DUF308 family)
MISPLSTSPAPLPLDERASLSRRWGLFLALGLASVVVGLLALSFVVIAALAKVVVLGVLLLIAGATEVIHAFTVRDGKSFALHLLGAALYLLAGLFLIEDPVRAGVVLALLLAAAFFVGGVLRILFSLGLQFPGWPWVLLNGVVDVLLGVLVFSGWPESSLEILGLFVGIDLLLHGWSWVILALSLRTYAAAPPA